MALVIPHWVATLLPRVLLLICAVVAVDVLAFFVLPAQWFAAQDHFYTYINPTTVADLFDGYNKQIVYRSNDSQAVAALELRRHNLAVNYLLITTTCIAIPFVVLITCIRRSIGTERFDIAVCKLAIAGSLMLPLLYAVMAARVGNTS
jgi:hypothetical protein